MRILVTSTSGAGHVHPLVPMARALDAAGHDVMWAIAPEAVSTVEGFGMRARPAGLNRSEASARARVLAGPDFVARFLAAEPRDRRVVVAPVMFAAVLAPAMLADLRAIVDGWRPDVLLHEPNEAAAAPLATSRGVPHVVVGFGGFVPGDVIAAAEEPLRRLWDSEGLEMSLWAGLYDDLYLHPFPPSFGSSTSLDTIRLMRPMGFDGVAGDVEPPAWLGELGVSRPCVYVTFGTEVASFAPIGIVANAFANLDADAVLTVGRGLDPDSIEPRPPNVRVEQYLPQRLVLARSSLLVSHAGSGAVLGAAACGIPQLCLPFAADQFENACAVAASGNGLSLDPHEVNNDSLCDSILRILEDDSFRASAQTVADEIAAMPQPAAYVSAIEGLVKRTP